MRRPTATATVIASNERIVPRVQVAGPCPVEGCDGQLDIRHERQYGKVYAVCPTCERRVLEVRQLRDLIARLKQEIANLKPIAPTRSPTRIERDIRDAEIERRYIAGETGDEIAAALGTTRRTVYDRLELRGVQRRPRGRRRAA